MIFQTFLCLAFFAMSYANVNNTEITKFEHNFCESRLQNNQPPEIYNAYTSLAISVFPFVFGFPKHQPYVNIAYALTFNGFASFHYHYHLDWIGKQADEISMILANYYGLNGLIGLAYRNKKNKRTYQFLNMLYMYLFLIINTIIKYDQYFPDLFGIYLIPSIYLIRKVALENNLPYKRHLFISLIGGLCWIISELHCTKTTQYGHVVWHFLFPMGFYKIILNYDALQHKLTNYNLISNPSDNF